MKIYTRTGDDGTTGLIGGQRVSKNDARVECMGTIDELNAALGLAAVTADATMAKVLEAVQNELFVIGSHLAAPDEGMAGALPPLEEEMATRLEMEMDAAETELSPLQYFILPGGCETAARLHLGRAVCRRAERLLVAFAAERPVERVIMTYVNRLSDWLFVQSRVANHRAGVADVPWRK